MGSTLMASVFAAALLCDPFWRQQPILVALLVAGALGAALYYLWQVQEPKR